MASRPIYEFYAELNDFEPKIWRRFQVVDDVTMARLGYIIQVLFEMKASHLMAIEVPFSENQRALLAERFRDGKFDPFEIYPKEDDTIWRYEIINEDMDQFMDNEQDVSVGDATEARLRQAITEPNENLYFNYDFGDDWWVSLKLEKVIKDKDLPGAELPRVMEGAGYGIVEDVGGVGGLEDLVRAFKKKKGSGYQQYSEWLGVADFDITAFDMEDMNFRLKKIPRIYKQCYEESIYPTQKSIDLIERKYLKKKI